MKCAILTAGFWADPNASEVEAVDCLKKKCGFWDKEKKQCLAQTIKGDLSAISLALINLSKAATLHTGVREQGKPMINGGHDIWG